MELQDHFRPPLSTRRHWHAFHNAWATYISSDLNARLPEGYFAEPNVRFGIEIDVAAFDDRGGEAPPPKGTGSVAVWTAPAPTTTIPLPVLTDVVEVLVFESSGGPTLAGAVELVSPANKDRAAHRDAFVSKCAAYLQQGVGVVVVDVVTDRNADLHAELLARLGSASASPAASDLYAAAYRPVGRQGETSLEIWQESLALGRSLSVLPLCLRGGLCLPLDLGATYERTCREQRIPWE